MNLSLKIKQMHQTLLCAICITHPKILPSTQLVSYKKVVLREGFSHVCKINKAENNIHLQENKKSLTNTRILHCKNIQEHTLDKVRKQKQMFMNWNYFSTIQNIKGQRTKGKYRLQTKCDVFCIKLVHNTFEYLQQKNSKLKTRP